MAKKNNENTQVVALAVVEAVKLVHSKPTAQEVADIRAGNPAFALAVDLVAEKFGKADKGARNRAAFSDITDDEWKLLPYAERTYKEALWPYICGHGTHPMTSLLQREEADRYYQQQKEHEGTGTPTGGRKPKILPIEEEVANILTRKKDWELIESVKQAGLTEASERMANLLPTIECPRFKELFAGFAPLVLMGKMKVTLAWLMCRDKNGLHSTKADADMAALMADGFFPTVMKPTLDGQVKELKDAGLDVTPLIEGWL